MINLYHQSKRHGEPQRVEMPTSSSAVTCRANEAPRASRMKLVDLKPCFFFAGKSLMISLCPYMIFPNVAIFCPERFPCLVSVLFLLCSHNNCAISSLFCSVICSHYFSMISPHSPSDFFGWEVFVYLYRCRVGMYPKYVFGAGAPKTYQALKVAILLWEIFGQN